METKINEIAEVLESIKYFNDEEKLGAFITAIVDVKESIDAIYNEHLPNLINNKEDVEKVKESMWDIREDFRHISYHIKDAEMEYM